VPAGAAAARSILRAKGSPDYFWKIFPKNKNSKARAKGRLPICAVAKPTSRFDSYLID